MKHKLIEHIYNDVYCRIGVSKVDGVGVISIKTIPKGTNPFLTLTNKKDKIISVDDSELTKIDENVKKIIKDFFGSQKSKHYDILADGPNAINISFYMNHSNRPNVDIVVSNKYGYLSFVTNRNIKIGEELFIDYRKYDDL